MGRPSKLSDRQWAEIGRRLAAGEGLRALAKEFKVSPSRISERFSERVPEIKRLATTLAETERAVEVLPVSEQAAVRNLADQLKAIGSNLARAATAGSATAARLAELAHEEARGPLRQADGKLDGAKVLGIVALSEAANKAAAPALKLVTASQDKVGEGAKTLEDLVAGGDDE